MTRRAGNRVDHAMCAAIGCIFMGVCFGVGQRGLAEAFWKCGVCMTTFLRGAGDGRMQRAANRHGKGPCSAVVLYMDWMPDCPLCEPSNWKNDALIGEKDSLVGREDTLI